MAFTAHADGPFDVCFENILVAGRTFLPHAPPFLILVSPLEIADSKINLQKRS